MTVKHIKADAIKYVMSDPASRFLIHVCNDKGVMGSGIAKQVKETWPDAYQGYRDNCNLGQCSWGLDNNCVNLVAQEGYRGYKGNYESKRYLNYGALSECLAELAYNAYFFTDGGQKEVVVPFKMGADRAGGDWEIVLEIVIYFLGNDFNITVCQLP